MFQPRSSEFEPSVAAIVDHLRAIEKELGKIGQKAGRRVAGNASVAGDQIADAIAPILGDLVDRFRRSRRAATRLGDEATRIGNRISRGAARRAADQVAQRPLLTLALVVGIGVLIGAAARVQIAVTKD